MFVRSFFLRVATDKTVVMEANCSTVLQLWGGKEDEIGIFERRKTNCPSVDYLA